MSIGMYMRRRDSRLSERVLVRKLEKFRDHGIERVAWLAQWLDDTEKFSTVQKCLSAGEKAGMENFIWVYPTPGSSFPKKLATEFKVPIILDAEKQYFHKSNPDVYDSEPTSQLAEDLAVLPRGCILTTYGPAHKFKRFPWSAVAEAGVSVSPQFYKTKAWRDIHLSTVFWDGVSVGAGCAFDIEPVLPLFGKNVSIRYWNAITATMCATKVWLWSSSSATNERLKMVKSFAGV